ncbi:unnamed protein product [Rhizophagus irregularis]|nr:unnamed protein product [Rhizophagus irregularis]
MERATNKILSNKDFVDFLHSNFLYTNGPSLFKILDQAIKKHATAPQRLKHYTEKYLRETLTSLLERFELYSPPLPPSTPPSTPIVYSYPPAFPIRQVTRLPIRTPSEVFWIRTRRKLDTFLDTFRKLPVQQQKMHNSEENFHFGIIYRTDYLLRNFNSFFVYFIQIKDRAYQDRFYEVIGGWQLAVFNNSNRRDNGHPMLEFTFKYNMQLSNDK